MARPDNNVNFRVIVIDDNAAIHDDFRKILTKTTQEASELVDMELLLFGTTPPAVV